MDTGTHYTLNVLGVKHFQWVPTCLTKLPNLYVKLRLNNSVWKTEQVKAVSPTWNDAFNFSTSETSSVVNLQLKRTSFLKNKRLGYVDINLSSLLEKCKNGEEALLSLESSSGATSASMAVLRVRLVVTDPRTPVSMTEIHPFDEPASNVMGTPENRQMYPNLTNAESNTSEAGAGRQDDGISLALPGPGPNPSASTDQNQQSEDLHRFVKELASKLETYYNSIGSFSKLDIFINAIDILSEIHPYSRLAWRATSALYKGVLSQRNFDRRVVDLVRSMDKALDFVHETESLPIRTKNYSKTIIKLLEEITECCLFVQKYTSQKFFGRVLEASTTREKMDAFVQSLGALERSIDRGIACHTAFVSSRISSEVDVLFLQSRLDPDKMDSSNRPQCLPGTRDEILNKIMDWAFSDTSPNVLWLHGLAGSGKSTVVATIAESFRGMDRLGAFLFFERGKSEANSVIRTIAFKLATFDSSIAKYVVKAIKQHSDVDSMSAATQFEKLLLEPLTAVSADMVGPVIVVLDALDECGTEESRRNLMELFKQGLPRLPGNFRVLVASRREQDIAKSLTYRPNSICTVELSCDSTIGADVFRYIDHEMRNTLARREVELSPDWPWVSNMKRLTEAAEGLFIWASTAIKMVDSDNPKQKLEELVANSRTLTGLDHLYASVLQNSGISFDDKRSKARFSQVLGLILLSKIPLSDSTIDGIWGFPSDEPSNLILSRLQCVLAYTPERTIRLLHTSFRDYLLLPNRAGDKWFIDINSQKQLIASRCFRVMKDGLRFNICDIESSFTLNDRIPDLASRIHKNIPSHLRYACLFYAQHLQEAPYSLTLLDDLSDFLRSRLLYWIEVLSLVNMIHHGSASLRIALTWAATQDVGTATFLREARELVELFEFPISQSAPHIYVSALPFSSKRPKVAAAYLEHTASIVQVAQRGHRQRTPSVEDLRGYTSSAGSDDGYTSSVGSVDFSPDGNCVVSGCDDNTVRVWDVRNDRMVAGPFKAHTDRISSVAFSPDGIHLASGSDDSTIALWDVQNQGSVSETLPGHVDKVSSVAFSPSGKYVVSGSDDAVVRIWDVDNLNSLHFQHADRICRVAFTPDGSRVLSGSADAVIKEWDVATGEDHSTHLKAHAGSITSMAFSPDGTRVVCGFNDGMIISWNAKTGAVLSDPFKGHTDAVTSVAFSPDGATVVSASKDTLIKIWSLRNGQCLGAFEGHLDGVTSVAFSPNGTDIVSGSQDKTIRVWDAAESIDGPSNDAQNVISNWRLAEDGWIVGPDDEPLIWVPPTYRATLWRPKNIALLNCDFSTRLDFSGAALGYRWQECYKPAERRRNVQAW